MIFEEEKLPIYRLSRGGDGRPDLVVGNGRRRSAGQSFFKKLCPVGWGPGASTSVTVDDAGGSKNLKF